MADPLPRLLQAYALALGAAALAFLGGAALALARNPPEPTVALAIGSGLFVVGHFVLERVSVRFRWRGHGIMTSFAEMVLFLGLVYLPPFLLVLLVVLPRAADQIVHRRPLVKSLINVSATVVSAGFAATAFVALTALGAPAVASAAAGAVLGLFVGDFAFAVIFAILEREHAEHVFRERFLVPATFSAIIGIPVGLVLIALERLHPLALLAALPLGVLAVRYSRLQARVDEELEVHRSLALVAQDLVGSGDEEDVAAGVLKTAGEVLTAGMLRLEIADGRKWERSFAAGASHRPPALTTPVLGRDGALLGTLTAWSRPGKPRFGEHEEELLRVIAGQTATALEAARALREVAAQRELMARQETLSTLGTLVAGVAHEINNPLTFMKLRVDIADMATRKVLDDGGVAPETRGYAEQFARNLAPLRHGIGRLEELTESLKRTARPGSGEREAVDVAEVLRHVVTVTRAGFTHVTWNLDLADALPAVHANPSQMHQVFLNLTKNAAEAVTETGMKDPRVSVRAWTEGDHVVVSVRDNGPGIPEDAQAQLFSTFFTTKKAGTGLGLSISRRIVHAHEGTITNESTAGGGATFVVRFPLNGGTEESRDAALADASG